MPAAAGSPARTSPSQKIHRRPRDRQQPTPQERRRRLAAIALISIANVLLLALACWYCIRGPRPAQQVEQAPAQAGGTDEEGCQANPPAAAPPSEVPETLPPGDDDIDDPPPANVPAAPEPLPPPRPVDEANAKPNPPPAPAAPKPPAAVQGSFRQRKGPSEMDLLKQLADAPEVGLTFAARESLAATYQTDHQTGAPPGTRPDPDP